MFMKNWKRDILTIPNLLSLFRLILIPVYVRIYLNARVSAQFYTAGAILAVSCLTDAVDGWTARHFNIISTLGKILDPLADKITQFTLTLCLSLRHPVLNPVLLLFVTKELFQLTLGAVNLSRGKMLPGALMSGKVCTTVLFVSLTALVVFPGMNSRLVKCIAMADAVFLLVAFVQYGFAYFGRTPKVRDLEDQ